MLIIEGLLNSVSWQKKKLWRKKRFRCSCKVNLVVNRTILTAQQMVNSGQCFKIVMMLWIWFTFCITKLLRTIASNALCNAVCSLRCEVFNASVNLLAQRWIERWNKQFTPQMKTTLVLADRQTHTHTHTRTWHQLLNYFAFSKWTTEIQILLRCPTWSGCPFGVASSPLTLAASPSMDPSSR